jgi:ribonuclease Z
MSIHNPSIRILPPHTVSVFNNELIVSGVSVAGVCTSILIRPVNNASASLLFDCGCLLDDSVVNVNNVCISHAHLDHSSAIISHIHRRQLFKLSAANYYLPTLAAQAFRRIIQHNEAFSQTALPANIIEIDNSLDNNHNVSGGYSLHSFPTYHRVESTGYYLMHTKTSLAQQFKGKTGAEIVAAKRSGQIIHESSQRIACAYSGDTIETFLDNKIFKGSTQIGLLIMELTFIEAEETCTETITHKESSGHVSLNGLLGYYHSNPHCFDRVEEILFIHISQRIDPRLAVQILNSRLPLQILSKATILLKMPPEPINPPRIAANNAANNLLSSKSHYSLGIDLGTTSVKICVVNKGCVAYSNEQPHSAAMKNLPAQHSEQSPAAIFSALLNVVRSIPPAVANQIRSVGVSCQMHGVVAWNKSRLKQALSKGHLILNYKFINDSNYFSSLTTWQDGRCSEELLNRLNSAVQRELVNSLHSGLFVAQGYGCAVLAHQLEQNASFFQRYDATGTIGDLLVWLLGLDYEQEINPVYISPSNAASWGLFHIHTNQWSNTVQTLYPALFALLPNLTTTPLHSPINLLCKSAFGLSGSESVKINVAEGDAGAAYYALSNSCNANPIACLSIGTSSQFIVLANNNGATTHSSGRTNSAFQLLEQKNNSPSIEYRPYLLSPSTSNSLLLVCASMNGGNSWCRLVEVVAQANSQLSTERIDEKLIKLGCTAIQSKDSSEWKELAEAYSALFLSVERYQDIEEFEQQQHRLQAKIAGAQPLSFVLADSNMFLACLARELCAAIIKQLHTMINRSITSKELELYNKVEGILIAGGALQRNKLLQHFTAARFNLPLLNLDNNSNINPDAALGVALLLENA